MNRLGQFFRTSLLGGVVVVLPVALLIFLVKWVFDLTTNAIQPLTNIFVSEQSHFIKEFFADMFVLGLIVMACFVVGVFVKTTLGMWVYHYIETNFLKKAPGYSLIKETVLQFLGNKKSPFSSVALVQLFSNDTMATAFITDTHEDGSSTVFVPTGPNPTSGNIYHLKKEYVHPIDVPVEDAMRSIISCGAGAQSVLKSLKKQ